MKLRGVEWLPVFNSSGARGFDGDGYWFHSLWGHLGLNYNQSVFVAKTTTLYAREGNMPLNPRTQAPREKLPKCIVVKPGQGVVLNAVGLSGPGADFLIDRWTTPGSHPSRDGQWMVSFMSVASKSDERVHEAVKFFEKLPKLIMANGSMNTGLQINLSCPNVGLDPAELIDEGTRVLDAADHLGIPILIKLNATVGVSAAKVLSDHRNCDGIVMSNSIPWGRLPNWIEWEKIFGSKESPLAHLGGGGLSGAPLLPVVSDWIYRARLEGIDKIIIGGGGILSTDDASCLLDAGADGIEIGSVSILRPWRVKGIIDYVNTRMGLL